MLSVRPEQTTELWETFQQWHSCYWRPVEIHREFASHFQQPHAIRRVFRRVLAGLRRPVLRYVEAKRPLEPMIAAE